MPISFPTVDMREVIAHAVFSSLSDIRRHTRLLRASSLGEDSGLPHLILPFLVQTDLKPLQGHGFHPGLLLGSFVEVPCTDDCHGDSVPPSKRTPSSGFEAELVKSRQHVKEVNISHELVCFDNGCSGNHYVFWMFDPSISYFPLARC